MIVVCNTSPLTNLAAIGQFRLLYELYGQLHIAEAVWRELNAGGQHWPGRDEVAAADWIERHTVQNQNLVTALRRDLDTGEAESIALAVEIGADLVLLDEREGRHAAQRLGLQISGVVGLLLEAKSCSSLTSIRPHLDALRLTAGFYLGEPVYRAALLVAGESDG
jgi:predicted nucleic acid-binding protein